MYGSLEITEQKKHSADKWGAVLFLKRVMGIGRSH